MGQKRRLRELRRKNISINYDFANIFGEVLGEQEPKDEEEV